MVYAITVLTSPLYRVNSALQRGTNISASEICVEWLVFSGMVTYMYIYTLSFTCTGHSISTVTRVAGAGEAAGGGIGAGGLRVAGTRYRTLINV